MSERNSAVLIADLKDLAIVVKEMPPISPDSSLERLNSGVVIVKKAAVLSNNSLFLPANTSELGFSGMKRREEPFSLADTSSALLQGSLLVYLIFIKMLSLISTLDSHYFLLS